jgi:PPOX class probable F420-dependent enzyme
MSALPDDVRTLLAGPNIAHVATLLPDGSPHSVAVWAGLTGDHPYFFTQERSRKARNLRADPRVALSLVDHRNPYATGWLRGRVAETIEGERALVLIDALAVKYTGEPFPMRSGTVFVVEASHAGAMTLPFRPLP